MTSLYSYLFDTAAPQNRTYPPYDVVKLGQDLWEAEFAVAGYNADDIAIMEDNGYLRIVGKGIKTELPEGAEYLSRGIARRSFELKFSLPEHTHVTAAELRDGLLRLTFKREVPEALKPRVIKITR